MLESIVQQLQQAVEQRKVCHVKLWDEPSSRKVEPHGIFQSRTKKVMMVVWQTAGFSGSNPLPGYRNLMVQDIESLFLLGEHFTPRTDFNPKDSGYYRWFFNVVNPSLS